MNKQKILIIALSVLLFVSFSYIAWGVLERVKTSLFYQGYEQAINEMVTEAQNENCEPIPVFYKENEVHLINIDCLQITEE